MELTAATSPGQPALTVILPSRDPGGDFAASRDRERSREYFSRLTVTSPGPALTVILPSRDPGGDFAASRDRERSREYFSRLITSDFASGNSAVPDHGGNSTVDGQQKRCDSSNAFTARVITDLPSQDPDGDSASKRSINGRSADRRQRSTVRLPLLQEINR